MSDETEFAHYNPGLLEDNSQADDQPSEFDLHVRNYLQSLKDSKVEEFQKLMQAGPLGCTYSGKIDGIIDATLVTAIQKLEKILQDKLGKPVVGTIVSGQSIVGSIGQANKLISEVNKLQPKPQATQTAAQTPPETKQQEPDQLPAFDPTSQIAPDSTIRAFQEFFSKSNPVIGSIYHGPIDGMMNDALKSAAQQTETTIAKEVKNDGAHGMIIDTKENKFNTTIADVAQALSMIEQYKNQPKKHSNLSIQDRVLKYSSLIQKFN